MLGHEPIANAQMNSILALHVFILNVFKFDDSSRFSEGLFLFDSRVGFARLLMKKNTGVSALDNPCVLRLDRYEPLKAVSFIC